MINIVEGHGDVDLRDHEKLVATLVDSGGSRRGLLFSIKGSMGYFVFCDFLLGKELI